MNLATGDEGSMVCPCSAVTLGRRGDDQPMGRGGGRCREGRWPGVEPGEEGHHAWRWEVSEEISSWVAECTYLILVKDGFGGDLGALDR
jgi:hypothetical protein